MTDTGSLETQETEAQGKAFIFALDAWVYNSPDFPPQQIHVAHGQYSYRIYPPLPNNPLRVLVANALGPNTAIPFPADAKVDPATLAVPPPLVAIPLIFTTPNGPKIQLLTAALDGTITPTSETFLPSNLLRIDIYGHGQDALPKASSLKTNLMRIVRWHTGQWWITRRTNPSISTALAYNINERGETVLIEGQGRAGAGVGVRTLEGYEKFLDNATWEQSIKDVFADVEPPAHWMQMLDAIYFLTAGDVAQSCLSAASGCDILKERTFEDLWQARHPGQRYSSRRRWQLINGWQMPEHIDTGLNTFIGRSYRTEHRQNWDNIKQLWEVRNSVAHGNAPTFGNPPATPIDTDLSRFISSGRHLLRWLETLI